MVLSHTTGLRNWGPEKLPFNSDPGERFGYSGVGIRHEGLEDAGRWERGDLEPWVDSARGSSSQEGQRPLERPEAWQVGFPERCEIEEACQRQLIERRLIASVR